MTSARMVPPLRAELDKLFVDREPEWHIWDANGDLTAVVPTDGPDDRVAEAVATRLAGAMEALAASRAVMELALDALEDHDERVAPYFGFTRARIREALDALFPAAGPEQVPPAEVS